MKPKPRDRLVETALRLFSLHGFHATGIDRILAEAGVAKMTLYRHFQSKEALILAVLERYEALVLPWVRDLVPHGTNRPEVRLRALFNGLTDWVEGRGAPADLPYRGCLFINAVVEYGDPDHPVHRAASAHLRTISDAILAGMRGSDLSAETMRLLDLIITGAVVVVQVHGDARVFAEARDASFRLLAREAPAWPIDRREAAALA